MPMMTLQVLKFVNFTKSQNSRFLKIKTFFLQIKKIINYKSKATLWQKILVQLRQPLTEKMLNYFSKVWNLYFSTYCQNSAQAKKLKSNQTYIQIWHLSFFLFFFFFDKNKKQTKKLKYFNDFKNRSSSVLLLEWTQTMEMKQN